MCKVYTGYCGTSEIEHVLCACMVDNPLAKARGLSLRTGAQTMLYLSLIFTPFSRLNFIDIFIETITKIMHESQMHTDFYTIPHVSGGMLCCPVGCPCVRPSQVCPSVRTSLPFNIIEYNVVIYGFFQTLYVR